MNLIIYFKSNKKIDWTGTFYELVKHSEEQGKDYRRYWGNS